MKRIWLIIFFGRFLFAGNLFAQVEHNYPMGPQKTNCDSLTGLTSDFNETLNAIKKSTWRFTQMIKLNRFNGVRSAGIYSCDGQAGFLIVISGNKECIYKSVPIILWNELLKTTGPEEFIEEKINKIFESYCNP